jgi:hypothetical protein
MESKRAVPDGKARSRRRWPARSWRPLLDAAPGERFTAFHERQKAWAALHPLASKAVPVIGFLVVLVALSSMVLPILPGFLFLIIGLALLGARFRGINTFLDRAEVRIRRKLCSTRWGRRRRGCRDLAGR